MIKKTYHPDDVLFASEDENCYFHLEYIQRHLIRSDFTFLKKAKQIFFYDHPALKSISSYAIKTDNIIFIDSDYFNSLSDCKMLKVYQNSFTPILNTMKQDVFPDDFVKKIITQLENVQFIKNIHEPIDNSSILEFDELPLSHPIVKMSDRDFLKLLKNFNLLKVHNVLEKEFDNLNNIEHKSLFTFSKKEKKYLTDFKNKVFPNFIHNYNKTLNAEGKDAANQLAEFFSAHIGSECEDLSNVGFAVVCSHFSKENIQIEYNLDIDNRTNRDMISIFYNAPHIWSHKRTILLEECCMTSDSQLLNKLVEYNKPSPPKKKM